MNWEISTKRQVLAALCFFGVLMALPAVAVVLRRSRAEQPAL